MFTVLLGKPNRLFHQNLKYLIVKTYDLDPSICSSFLRLIKTLSVTKAAGSLFKLVVAL